MTAVFGDAWLQSTDPDEIVGIFHEVPGMSASSHLLLAACAVVAVAGLGACVVAPPPGQPGPVAEVAVVAPGAPPPLRAEVPPPLAPERAELVVWVPGRWHWDGREWAWRPGHYQERPYANAAWVPGHWAERPSGWVWVEGHWR
jgi:hypothetical protein